MSSKTLTYLDKQVLHALAKATFRGESSLCRQLDKAWKYHRNAPMVRRMARSEKVEDSLFKLVHLQHVEWFGGEDGATPMNYKLTLQGRNVEQRLRLRAQRRKQSNG